MSHTWVLVDPLFNQRRIGQTPEFTLRGQVIQKNLIRPAGRQGLPVIGERQTVNRVYACWELLKCDIGTGHYGAFSSLINP